MRERTGTHGQGPSQGRPESPDTAATDQKGVPTRGSSVQRLARPRVGGKGPSQVRGPQEQSIQWPQRVLPTKGTCSLPWSAPSPGRPRPQAATSRHRHWQHPQQHLSLLPSEVPRHRRGAAAMSTMRPRDEKIVPAPSTTRLTTGIYRSNCRSGVHPALLTIAAGGRSRYRAEFSSEDAGDQAA